jgi:hypothetical protein
MHTFRLSYPQIRPTGCKTTTGRYIKKKAFSSRSRKAPNPCSPHTQWHRRPYENDCDRGRILDPCFSVGWNFLIPTWNSPNSHTCHEKMILPQKITLRSLNMFTAPFRALLMSPGSSIQCTNATLQERYYLGVVIDHDPNISSQFVWALN